MTREQIIYIVSTLLSDNVNTYTPLNNVALINLACNENVFPNINETRIKFDTASELMRVAKVRKYSNDINNVPAHGNYDIVNSNGSSTVYEYYTDPDGLIITDTYSFDCITGFNPKAGVKIYED